MLLVTPTSCFSVTLQDSKIVVTLILEDNSGVTEQPLLTPEQGFASVFEMRKISGELKQQQLFTDLEQL